MEIVLDEWQKEVLNTKGNIVVRSGRQVGKSTIIAKKAAKYGTENPNRQILIISATERQAYLLFSKVLMEISDNYKSFLKKGRERPTKSEIKLKNNSTIRCLPTGLDGIGIRGYTTDMLIADEAHFIPEEVWNAVTPQLTTTEAIQILISTTHGRQGYFYKCFQDEKFTKFHVTTQEVAEKRAEPQRTNMLEHVEREKKIKSRLEFAQEYLGEFVDELRQLYPEEILKSQLVLERRHEISKGAFFLGVDVARMGEDESTFEILDRINRESFVHVENITTSKTLTTETTQEILKLEKVYKFKKIGIDDGGLGVAVFDALLRESSVMNKIIPLNNSRRSLNSDSKKPERKRLLKEDMYFNLLSMLEKGKLKLLKDDEVYQSLKGVQYEYNDDGKIRIFSPEHKNSHIVEGLIRAAWVASEDKSLNLYVFYT